MACESTAATPQISYFTSTNGTSWTAQTAFTAFTYNAVTPQLWLNPNNGNYYLFYAYCSGVNYYVINYRTATTVAGLETAADNTILRSPGTNNPFVYAPYVTYDTASGLYVMQVETVPNTSSGGPDTTWYVVTLLSSSIDGPWTVAAGRVQFTPGDMLVLRTTTPAGRFIPITATTTDQPGQFHTPRQAFRPGFNNTQSLRHLFGPMCMTLPIPPLRGI